MVTDDVGGFRLLRSITAGMLLMWDRGFHDFEMFQIVRKLRAHALARLSALIEPEYVRTLSDGSRLAYLYPAGYRRKTHPERLLIRVIE
jgi:hypothetical protein